MGREFVLALESGLGADLEADLESRLESGREPDRVVGREPVRASDCDSGRVLPEVRSSFLFEELAFAAL